MKVCKYINLTGKTHEYVTLMFLYTNFIHSTCRVSYAFKKIDITRSEANPHGSQKNVQVRLTSWQNSGLRRANVSTVSRTAQCPVQRRACRSAQATWVINTRVGIGITAQRSRTVETIYRYESVSHHITVCQSTETRLSHPRQFMLLCATFGFVTVCP
jgi:hypothetical protein